MNVAEALRHAADVLLDQNPDASANEVVNLAYEQHSEVFATEAQRLVADAARRQATKLMSKLSDNEDSQPVLPGLKLPSTIAVEADSGEFRYVRLDKADWTVLERGRVVRERNAHRALAKLDVYRDAAETLRPEMEGTSRTVLEAARRIGLGS